MKKMKEIKNKKDQMVKRYQLLDIKFRADETHLGEDLKRSELKSQIKILNWILAK